MQALSPLSLQPHLKGHQIHTNYYPELLLSALARPAAPALAYHSRPSEFSSNVPTSRKPAPLAQPEVIALKLNSKEVVKTMHV